MGEETTVESNPNKGVENPADLSTRLRTAAPEVEVAVSAETYQGVDNGNMSQGDDGLRGSKVNIKGERLRPVAAMTEPGCASGQYHQKESGELMQMCQTDNNALVSVPVRKLRRPRNRVMAFTSQKFRAGWDRIFGSSR